MIDAPRAAAFAAALRDAGITGEVEARDRVAVLTAGDLSALVTRRIEIVALAQHHGFTNVCVDLPEER